jgi:hypothetical protein
VAEALTGATDCSGALDGVTNPIADGVREAPEPGGGVKAVAEASGRSCLCWLRFGASEGVAGADRSSGPPSEVVSSDAASEGVAGADDGSGPPSAVVSSAAAVGIGDGFTTGDSDAAEGGAAVGMSRADRRVMSSMTVVKLLLTASVGLDRI